MKAAPPTASPSSAGDGPTPARKPPRPTHRSVLTRPWKPPAMRRFQRRSEEHTSELQSQSNLVCRLLLEKKKNLHSALSDVCRVGFNRHRCPCRDENPG